MKSQKQLIFFQSEVEVPKTKQVQDWSMEIAELEKYFSEIELPNQPVKLKDNSTVTNHLVFIDSHLAAVKANSGNLKFKSYLERLQYFAETIRG